jgi:transcriptional regulator with XRE-family HTH domain
MSTTDHRGTDALADGLPVRLVSVNDVVSMNLAHFRKAVGLSQQELANQIGWLKQVVSTAERSWEGRRKRNFTVSDLIDIASGLGIPFAALLLPPEDDGITVTYMVDGFHNGGEMPLRDLLPFVLGFIEGESPAMAEYRKRLIALGAYNVLSDRATRATFGMAGGMAGLLEERDRLERRVEDLRTFEREYRQRQRHYIEDQYRAFWAGTEGADPDALLSAMRDQAVGKPHVITIPAAGARDDKAPEDALLVMLPEEAQRLGLAGASNLRSRGIPGPYIIAVADDGSVTVSSASADESVRVEEEPAGEGKRLSAVLLP